MFTRIAIALIFLSQISFAYADTAKPASAKDVAAVKQKLESYLVDPSAVKYRNIRGNTVGKQTLICLEYSAKDGIWGYTGFIQDACIKKGKNIKCAKAYYNAMANSVLGINETQEDRDAYKEHWGPHFDSLVSDVCGEPEDAY